MKKKTAKKYWQYFLIILPVVIGIFAIVLVLTKINLEVYLEPFSSQLIFRYFQNKTEADTTNRLEPAPMADVVRNQGIYQSKQPISKVQTSFKVPILTYHHIEESNYTAPASGLYLNPRVFDSQLETLRDAGYQPIFTRELGEALVNSGKLPAKSIALTFDDGYKDFYQNVFPLLKKYNFKATAFVIVNNIGKPGYLSEDEVRGISQSGLVEIGSHTLSHISLKFTDDEKAKTEIVESKRKLERIIGDEVKSFAYPFGFFIDRDERLVEEAGYLVGLSIYPGLYQKKENIFRLYRLRPEEKTGESLIRFVSQLK